jgi:hypothetical protein
MTTRKPTKKAADEAWEALRELLIEFPTPRTRTWVQDVVEHDGPEPQRPRPPANYMVGLNYRVYQWERQDQNGREAIKTFEAEHEAWGKTARVVTPRHAEYGTLYPANLLAPLLVAVGREQFGEIPLFAINQITPEYDLNQVGAGCSLLTECISIIVQDCEPLVWRPRPRTQFDRDLDRAMIDQDSMEVTDHRVVVVDRPEPTHINMLATTWRDPNYKHQPYWRKGTITMTASELRMQQRTFFITGRNLKAQAEKFGATHRMIFCDLRWDDGPTSYSKTRTELKEWVMAERDRLHDAALVMIKDGWLQRNYPKWQW